MSTARRTKDDTIILRRDGEIVVLDRAAVAAQIAGVVVGHDGIGRLDEIADEETYDEEAPR